MRVAVMRFHGLREDRMTEEELAQIRARADTATPGPWECRNAGGTIAMGEVIRLHRVRDSSRDAWLIAESTLSADQKSHDEQDANMEFIAQAREDVPDLLVEVERLRAENAELRKVLADLMDSADHTMILLRPDASMETIERVKGTITPMTEALRAARAWLAAHPEEATR